MTRLFNWLKNQPTWLVDLRRKFLSYSAVGVANATLCITLMCCGSYGGLNYFEYTILGYGVTIFFSFL